MSSYLGECRNGDVQLIDGDEISGTVRVCIEGIWGSVCGRWWDETDASVVCKQLGISEGL